MTLVWVLVLTALLVSDVAGTDNCLRVEETQWNLEKRGISRGPCDENWFYFPPSYSCYQFFSQKMTWQEAVDFCNQDPHYGQLASVISSEHNNFISDVVSAVDKNKPLAWIGLNDRCEEGTYTWIDGSSGSFQEWYKNQPDNYKDNEDCVHTHNWRHAAWNDADCDSRLGFVCSYKLRCS